MSKNHLSKINTKIFGQILVIGILLLVILGNTRFISENILRSKGIDEKIVTEANPRLNRQRLQEAIAVLDNFAKAEELTSIFSSATLEQEVTEPGVERIITIEIQNASGINGAAAILAEKFRQIGINISKVSTAPARQNTTSIVYKAGNAEEAKAIEELLKTEGWPVGSNREAAGEIQSDIKVIIGK